MTGSGSDWDPRDPAVLRDQIAAYDAVRERAPVAHSAFLGWSVMRHADALAVLEDHVTFSSRVSVNTAVPNGLDPPEHAPYRAVVNRSFAMDRVAAFEPELRSIAVEVLEAALEGAEAIEVMASIAEPFAARAQCAYLGWPHEVADALRAWAADSARATLARDPAELARVAARFDAIIVEMLDQRRAADGDAPHTLTGWLLEQRVDGAPLSDATLVSMLRNWTAGELGTIAAAAGIVTEFLARRPDLQEHLRTAPEARQGAMDEILRLDAPLIANRRRTTRPVTLQGRHIPADAPVTILWPAAQRDPVAVPEPAEYRSDRDPRRNLLYGRGPHACPGEGLARLELGVILDELFRALPALSLAPDRVPARASYPAGGFREVWIAGRA